MTRTDRTAFYTVIAIATPIIIILAIVVSPRDPLIRNQMKLVQLLAKAHPQLTTVEPLRIQTVIIGDHLTLLPDRDQVVAGYILRAHVQSATFMIEAQPVEVGKTGFFSYFRDEAGVIRFEMDKRATAESRPLY